MKISKLIPLLSLVCVATTQTIDYTMRRTVRNLIRAGTCEAVANGDNCGDAAEGYYDSFIYNGNRVIISSGAPNHACETDAYVGGTLTTRFSRCKYSHIIISLIILSFHN